MGVKDGKDQVAEGSGSAVSVVGAICSSMKEVVEVPVPLVGAGALAVCLGRRPFEGDVRAEEGKVHRARRKSAVLAERSAIVLEARRGDEVEDRKPRHSSLKHSEPDWRSSWWLVIYKQIWSLNVRAVSQPLSGKVETAMLIGLERTPLSPCCCDSVR